MVTVVIPTLNEELCLPLLLDSLLRQSSPPDRILVVDGGSSDATQALANCYPEVELVAASPPVGNQRQEGLLAASDGWVVFLDADCVIEESFLEDSLAEADRRRLGLAIPVYRPITSNLAIRLVFRFFNAIFFLFQKLLPSGGGMCMLAKRQTALAAGGFKPSLRYEDIEFLRRVARTTRFGRLRAAVDVSARRFEQHGVLRTTLRYLLLSALFTFGLFKAAEAVPYRFADYEAPEEERVELVSPSGEPLMSAPKRSVHCSRTPLHRAFSLFVFDPAGRLLLQRRAEGKLTWPGQWSNSCCGHPAPGESVVEAARRRARAELGLELEALRVVLPDYSYRAELNGLVEHELCPVLVARAASQPSPDPEEVADIDWVNWGEFLTAIQAGTRQVTPWCLEETLLLSQSGAVPSPDD